MTPVSLDLSRKIAKLAKEKDIKLLGSDHCWCQYNETQWEVTNLPFYADIPRMDNQYPAYSVDELLDMLPDTYADYRFKLWMKEDVIRDYVVGYGSIDANKIIIVNQSPAEALALLLIWLLEQGYMEEK